MLFTCLRAQARCSDQLFVSKALDNMIVHHPHGLHESVANGRAHKCEPSADKIFAHRIGFSRTGGDLFELFPAIYLWFAAHETPDISIETPKLLLDDEKGFGVFDGGVDLKPVTNDPWIRQQFLDFSFVIAGDQIHIKVIESAAIALPLLQNG